MRNRKLKTIILTCSLIALAEFLLVAFGRELVPSRLTVHAPQRGWRSITLDGNSITQSNPVVRVSPIVYGPHDLRIELANGKIVWASFFHSDTRVVRQLDIYVEYKPGSDTVTFRETNTRYETFPGITWTVFTGSVKPEETSATKPLTLDWI